MNLSAQTEVNYSSPVIVMNKIEHQRIKKIFLAHMWVLPRSVRSFWDSWRE